MAVDGFKIFDSDLHILEPVDLWPRYIEPKYKDQAPVGKPTTGPFSDMNLLVGGRVVSPSGRVDFMSDEGNADYAELAQRRGRLEQFIEFEQRGWGPDTELEAMDAEGVDMAVLYPTRGLSANAMEYDDDGLAAAIARAYNDWLAEYCSAAPERMYGAAMVLPQNIDATVAEVRRASRELGFKAIFIRPNPVRGRNWHDPAYDPIWQACEEEGLLVGFHEGMPSMLPCAVAERFDGRYEDDWLTDHVARHPVEMMYASLSMIMGGVFERFAGLRVAFLEANCSWVPYWLWRMDEHYELRERVAKRTLSRLPTEYFKQQCFVSIEADEETAGPVIDKIADNVVFSTDFPHPDSAYPNAVKTFLKLPIDDDEKRKILWDNCVRMYGIS